MTDLDAASGAWLTCSRASAVSATSERYLKLCLAWMEVAIAQKLDVRTFGGSKVDESGSGS